MEQIKLSEDAEDNTAPASTGSKSYEWILTKICEVSWDPKSKEDSFFRRWDFDNTLSHFAPIFSGIGVLYISIIHQLAAL